MGSENSIVHPKKFVFFDNNKNLFEDSMQKINYVQVASTTLLLNSVLKCTISNTYTQVLISNIFIFDEMQQ